MNNWNFTGNLGHSAEQRFAPNGDSVVSFSVAVKSGYGDKEQTTWAKCSMWGKRGESVLPYLTKGQLVGISGEVTLREYERKDGSGKGYSLEVRVNDLTLLGRKGDAPADMTPAQRTHSEAKANGYQPGSTTDGGFGDMGDDVPFSHMRGKMLNCI